MKKILIATHNRGKLNEIEKGLKSLENKGVKILSLLDLSIQEKPEETGKTFEENSKLKAKFYADLTKLPTIADDGGLIIPYLNNEPGVKSRRWPGHEATDEELIQYTLFHLEGVRVVDRTAYLQTCLCFYNPPSARHPEFSSGSDSKKFEKQMLKPAFAKATMDERVWHDNLVICEEGKIKGRIAEKPIEHFTPGYPYRALFIVERFGKYYDELTPTEHDEVNHRLKALKRLVQRIEKYLIE